MDNKKLKIGDKVKPYRLRFPNAIGVIIAIHKDRYRVKDNLNSAAWFERGELIEEAVKPKK